MTADANTTSRSPMASAAPPEGERKGLAKAVLDLFAELDLAHDADGTGYAMPIIGGAHHVLKLKSAAFRRYIRQAAHLVLKKSLPAETLHDVTETLQSRAEFEGPELEFFMRTAHVGNEIWLDLSDVGWRGIRVTSEGWQIVERPEVLFVRGRYSRPVPEPARGRPGALDRAFDLFGLTVRERTLVRVWLLATMRGQRPFPVLAVVGEAGAGKSTLSEWLRSLVDPAEPALRSPPREERDLVAAARGSYVIAFENISTIGPELSDCLCRLATGAGIGGRELYTNDEEVVFDAARPVLLNGIPDLPARSDLIDRSLVITLKGVPEGERRLLDELEAELEALRPAALAELLDAASQGLARFEALKRELRERPRPLPRMADAALWAEACGVERAVETMLATRSEGLAELAEADPVAAAIRELLTASGGTWSGTMAEVLAELDARREGARPPVGWPSSAHAMGNKLRRLAPALREIGISTEHGRRGADKARIVTLRPGQIGTTSATSATDRPVTEKKPM